MLAIVIYNLVSAASVVSIESSPWVVSVAQWLKCLTYETLESNLLKPCKTNQSITQLCSLCSSGEMGKRRY